MPAISIGNTTQGRPPNLPFERMKDAILGKDYELSLVFIGDKRSRTLNHTYRNKDKPTNVLSFPLDKKTGEIFITLPQAKRETKSFGVSYTHLVGFLFIHGLLHLDGLDHGSTMDKAERRFCAQFHIPYPYES